MVGYDDLGKLYMKVINLSLRPPDDASLAR